MVSDIKRNRRDRGLIKSKKQNERAQSQGGNQGEPTAGLAHGKEDEGRRKFIGVFFQCRIGKDN